MIIKRIKKISKLVFLISVRQIWKLLCNLYHMVEEPFLTFKKLIVKDRDKSQMFLVGLFFLMPFIAYFMARVIWDHYRFGTVINGVGMFFLITGVAEVFLLTYLIYWILKVTRSK